MSLSGNFIDAETACAWRLVNRVIVPHELLATASALSLDIAGIDPARVHSYRSLIDDGFVMRLGETLLLKQERSSAANRFAVAEVVGSRRALLRPGRKHSRRPRPPA